jgi:general secretion pathway protein L
MWPALFSSPTYRSLMSLLVLQLPARQRLAAGTGGETAPVAVGDAWAYAYSEDGQRLSRHGQAPLSLLPKSASVCAVAALSDVSWHRLDLPKSPAAKLRAALGGLLEERLLEDPAELHFALAPGLSGGQNGWVAALHAAHLRETLALLAAQGLAVERLVPALAPTPASSAAQGRFTCAPGAPEVARDGNDLVLWLASKEGVNRWPLASASAREALRTAGDPSNAPDLSALPATAAAAERWFGAPVAVLSEGEQLWAAANAARPDAAWNLLQFDLRPRHRGWQAMRALGKRLLSRDARPLRWGLAALVGVNLLGLNAWAWTQERQVARAKAEQALVLRETFPQLRSNYEPALQMAAQTQRLREQAGRPGPQDLETLLNASAAIWPDGLAAAQTVRFEPGKLSLAMPAPDPAAQARMQAALRPMGLQVRHADGVTSVQAAASAAPSAGAR